MNTQFLFNILNDTPHLPREIDRLLGAAAFHGRAASVVGADIDLGHDDEALYVEMAAPGFAPEDIHLTLEDDVLRISARRPAVDGEGTVTWHRRERSAGELTHRLRIPVEVDRERITAVCKNGILTVTLPKAAAAKPRRIEVKVEK